MFHDDCFLPGYGTVIYRGLGKRALDIVISIITIIMLSPLLFFVALMVRWRYGSPILFRQQRPGLHGRPFHILKFRTMTDARDSYDVLLPDDKRVTPFGLWLRSTSLDELPELWNVLKGDMSLVGPRPLLMNYLPHYTVEQFRRHDVRPGLTGLAQVSGRNKLSWTDKFALDVRYVQRYGLLMDLRILMQTVWKVLSRDGITADGMATAAAFESAASVVTIGAGGHGKVVVSILQACGIRVESVYDDDPLLWGSAVLGVPVTGPIAKLKSFDRRRCVIGIGDNKRREAIAAALDLEWITAVHPTAIIHSTTIVSPGAVICAGAVLQPDCHVGQHAIVNTAATIDHDCTIGSFASVGPGARLAGGVRVGSLAMVGTGASLLPGVHIGLTARIGGGATVHRDIPDGITAYGCPARPSGREPPRPAEGSWPAFDDEQIAAVESVLRSGKVNMWTGNECTLFEQEYAATLGVSHAIAVANGTLALELALYALGIGAGDEVIVPSRTFIATASAVVMRGAKPVVADIDPQSQNITANSIHAALSPRTKAIMAVHLGGWPCDMDPIMAIAHEHGLFVIEDCAQAHGARYKGRPVGSIGHINAFSFCQDKIITTGGEGGLISTNDHDLWDRAWSHKDHGKSRKALEANHPPGTYRFIHDSFGTNWRMTEMQAALGRVQLRRLPDWVATRRDHAERIRHGLGNIPGLSFPWPDADFYHSFYRLYGFIDPAALAPGWNRDRIINALLDRGVTSGCGSCGEIYRERAFEPYRPSARLAVASRLHDTSLVFLVHPTLSQSQINRMIEECRMVFSRALHGGPSLHRAA